MITKISDVRVWEDYYRDKQGVRERPKQGLKQRLRLESALDAFEDELENDRLEDDEDHLMDAYKIDNEEMDMDNEFGDGGDGMSDD